VIRLFYQFSYGCILLLLACFTAEVTSRVEDRLRSQTALLSTLNYDYDLFQNDSQGKRIGKPGGRYKKWKLNSLGCRSGEISEARQPGKKRVLILGSSETFGVFESPDKEYPAQLHRFLNAVEPFEVLNTALPGMTLKSCTQAFESRWKAFQPDVVVIYASPLFYLNLSPETGKSIFNKSAEQGAPSPQENPAKPPFELRLVQRCKDMIDKPEFWQQRIDAQALAEKRAALGKNEVFREVPEANLELYLTDLRSLIDAIQATGATPLLMTHAVRSASPPSSRDLIELEAFLHHTPRATPEILLAYESQVRERMLMLAEREQVPVVDLAEAINGKREAFGDMVHFSDAGATTAAKLLAEAILALTESHFLKKHTP
jgi:lysophospholipase L1-like esterase